MFALQLKWAGRRVTVADGFPSRQEAEWAASKWRQEFDCHGDPFAVAEVTDFGADELVDVAGLLGDAPA